MFHCGTVPPWRRYSRLTMVGRQKTLMIRALLVAAAWFVIMPGRPGSRQAPDPLAARTKGRPDAPVTVYEMSDFQCPYCREFALGTMPLLEREYVQTGKVRFVYINLPLSSVHKNAATAAEVGLCAARQERFWPMHDLLFRRQDQWAALASPRAYLLALGDSAGLDRARLASCVASGPTAENVHAGDERGRRYGATSTPTYYNQLALPECPSPVTDSPSGLNSISQDKTEQSH